MIKYTATGKPSFFKPITTTTAICPFTYSAMAILCVPSCAGLVLMEQREPLMNLISL